MKKTILSIFIAAFAVTAYAQESIWADHLDISPIINEDCSATFRIKAPEAENVILVGDLAKEGNITLEKGEDGIWSWSSAPLETGIYSYLFVVDGVRTIDPDNTYVLRDVRSEFNFFIVERPGEKCPFVSGDVPHGDLAFRWYDCEGTGNERRLTVYTPAEYRKDKGRRFPVLYLLHGMGGDEEAWISLGRAVQILDNMIASGKAEPMIVVMPNGDPAWDAAPGNGDNGNHKPSFQGPCGDEKAFIDSFGEIVSFIDSNYRTIRKSSGRAIAGLSAGGGQTMRISKKFNRTFDYVGLFSASVKDFDGGEGFAEQFGEDPELYFIAIGKDDFLYQENVSLRKFLDEKGYRYEYMETEGGHTWANWRNYLTVFIGKIF